MQFAQGTCLTLSMLNARYCIDTIACHRVWQPHKRARQRASLCVHALCNMQYCDLVFLYFCWCCCPPRSHSHAFDVFSLLLLFFCSSCVFSFLGCLYRKIALETLFQLCDWDIFRRVRNWDILERYVDEEDQMEAFNQIASDIDENAKICAWHRRTTCDEYFRPIVTNEGRCYTFVNDQFFFLLFLGSFSRPFGRLVVFGFA